MIQNNTFASMAYMFASLADVCREAAEQQTMQQQPGFQAPQQQPPQVYAPPQGPVVQVQAQPAMSGWSDPAVGAPYTQPAQPVSQPQTAPPQPQQPVEGPQQPLARPEPLAATLEEVHKTFGQLMGANKALEEPLKALITAHGVHLVSEIDPAHYETLIQQAQALAQ